MSYEEDRKGIAKAVDAWLEAVDDGAREAANAAVRKAAVGTLEFIKT
jgi:hypothetical protein